MYVPATSNSDLTQCDSDGANTASDYTRSADAASSETRQKKTRKKHKNSRLGCAECRKRRVKCDEAIPVCKNCSSKSMRCSYLDYSFEEIDHIRKEHIKRDGGDPDSEEHKRSVHPFYLKAESFQGPVIHFVPSPDIHDIETSPCSIDPIPKINIVQEQRLELPGEGYPQSSAGVLDQAGGNRNNNSWSDLSIQETYVGLQTLEDFPVEPQQFRPQSTLPDSAQQRDLQSSLPSAPNLSTFSGMNTADSVELSVEEYSQTLGAADPLLDNLQNNGFFNNL